MARRDKGKEWMLTGRRVNEPAQMGLEKKEWMELIL